MPIHNENVRFRHESSFPIGLRVAPCNPTSHAAMSGGWPSQADGEGEGDHPPRRGREARAGLHEGRPGKLPAVARLGLDGLGAADPQTTKSRAYGRERSGDHSPTPRPVKKAAAGAVSNRGRGVNRFSANPRRPIALVPYGVARASAQVSSSSRAGHSSCPQSVRPYSTFGGT